MDNFRIDIGTNNAAFKDPAELARLVAIVSSRLRDGERSGVIHDSNGNKVGRFDHLENIE